MQRELKVEKMRKSNPPGEPIGVVIPGSGTIQLDAYYCTVRYQGLFASSSFAVAPGTDENSKEVQDMKEVHFKAAEDSILSRLKEKSNEFRSQNTVILAILLYFSLCRKR